jgi:hypothetical protein
MSFEILLSPEVKTRQDLALLCNARKFWRVAEIGTDIGLYASQFLERWRGEYFFCVDPYSPYDEMTYDRTGDMLVAVQTLQRFHPKVKFIRAASPCAAKLLPEWIMLEFAYIDGCHEYEAVKADLQAWWDRLYNGPVILAGHDFDVGHLGVMRAVKEFCEEKQVTIYTTDESLPSWYCYKEPPEELIPIIEMQEQARACREIGIL